MNLERLILDWERSDEPPGGYACGTPPQAHMACRPTGDELRRIFAARARDNLSRAEADELWCEFHGLWLERIRSIEEKQE